VRRSPTQGIELADLVERTPFAAGPVVSGSRFERGVLGDGRELVLKHLPAEGDWLTRFSGGLGRARALWDDGVLEALAAHVDHAVVAMLREDDHDVVVMEDVAVHLLPRGRRLSSDAVDGLLGGLGRLHREWEGSDLSGLCSPADRHRIAAPAFHRDDTGPDPCPFRGFVLRGWEAFSAQVPDDVSSAVFAVLDDLDALGRQLEEVVPPTLLHGDAKLGNLGLRGEHLVALDWGELTGTGPAEMDVTWFAATSTYGGPGGGTWAVDAMPDDVFRAYETRSGRHLDPHALDLACIGTLAQHGFLLAGVSALSPDSATGARASQQLDWWVARVGRALETWSPT
jgi:hypothetical protein